MNMTKRDQMLLLGMVLIIATFVFLRFGYMPNREKVKSLTTAQQELQIEQKRLEAAVQSSPAAIKENEKYANLNKRLPTEDELVPLLTVLDASCQKCKVPLTSMEYRGAQPKSASGAQTLVFTVATKGKVTQLFDFLAELENNPRLISVEEVALTAIQAEQKQQNTTVTEESGPPVYYIAPPGMPEAKLQRVTFETEATKTTAEDASEAERPVAASLVPDRLEMKITINAYYAAQSKTESSAKSVDKTVKASSNKS